MAVAVDDMAWFNQLNSAPAITSSDGPSPENDSVARLRGIFASLDDEIIAAVVSSNRGALVPSILQLIELANEDETAACIDELEAALQDAAIRDEVPRQPDAGSDFDEQLALAAQSEMDEQVALALQQKLDEDAATAARAGRRAATPSAAGARAATPPAQSSWRRNVAKLAAKLSPSELRQLSHYRSRADTARLIEPNDAGSEAGVTTDNNESDDADRAYEPPVPPPSAPPTDGAATPATKPPPAALYESRLARARTARLSQSRPVRQNDGFTDLSLSLEEAA